MSDERFYVVETSGYDLPVPLPFYHSRESTAHRRAPAPVTFMVLDRAYCHRVVASFKARSERFVGKRRAEADMIAASLNAGEGIKKRHLGPRRYWTRERIIKALQTFVERNGKQPAYSDAKPYLGLPSGTVVQKEFGSWNAGIAAAGLTPLPRGGVRNGDTP
jgi:hypothetical protein